MFVLFLGLLLVTLEKKPKSLVKRINNAFRMFAISEFVDEYEPSKYAKDLYNENADVNNLSVKIQLVKECVMSVLDFLKLDDTAIQKVALAKVSNLMDAMDIFVAIAKDVKQPSILADLQKAFPDITSADTWRSKLAVEENVKDAVEFIKDTIHADSVVNLSKRKQLHDEINESNSEEQFEDNEVDQLEDLDSEDDEEAEKPQKEEKVEKLAEKKTFRKKYGEFYEIPSPARKDYIESEDSEDKSDMEAKDEKKSELKGKVMSEEEYDMESENESQRLVENKKSHAATNTVPVAPLPLRKSSLARRKNIPTRTNPRFLSSEEIKKINKEKADSRKKMRKERVSNEPHHDMPVKSQKKQDPCQIGDENCGDDGEMEEARDNKKLDAVLDSEAPRVSAHEPLVHRKSSKQNRKENDEAQENENENNEEDNLEEDSDNDEEESDEVEDN
jgi:hypothetical protein